MKSPLIVDKRDFKWNLLGNVLKIFDSRRVQQEIAKHGIKPADKAGVMFRVVIIAFFFSSEISYVISELKKRDKLRRFAGVLECPPKIRYMSLWLVFLMNSLMECVLGILAILCKPRGRGKALILVDSTDIPVDLNFKRRKITKKSLKDKDVNWCKSPSKGYYIGFKLTLALDYRTLRPLCFLLHKRCTYDSKLFEPIMDELQRRRIIRKGDKVVFDKGYYKYDNYIMGISRYKIVPLIFPRKNTNLQKILNKLTYPLNEFRKGKISEKAKNFFKGLKREFKNKIKHWKDYKPKRALIEDVFTLKKEGLSMKNLHRYTERSVMKIIAITALLAGAIISLGYNTNQKIQKLAIS